MPMAGIGKRFKKENFKTIKPLILVDNECIFEKSIKNLPNFKNKYIILLRNIFDKKKFFKKIILKNKFKPILLSKKTEGQADTVYKIKNIQKIIGSVFIHSCDYILNFNIKKFSNLTTQSDIIVFVTKLNARVVKDYKSFAYCKIKNNSDKIVLIKEKKTISKYPQKDNVIVGTFWFKNINDYYLSQEISLKKKQKINNEFYIATNINHMIKLGYKVRAFPVDTWINLGDIFDFKQYIYWKNFYLNKKW